VSEAAQGALIGGGIGFLSLLITLWFNARARKDDQQQRAIERREDYSEWYRRTLFERRLQAVQQAYAWWRRLNEAVGRASGNPDPNSAERAMVRELGEQARQWYDNNSLCLERPGSSEFVGLTNSALDWANGRDVNIQKSLNEVYNWIRNLADWLLGSEDPQQAEASHGG
jgi:hypothetical protein